MHTYEILAQMIIEELIKVRKDFKLEIQRLGDRLEKCLSLQAAGYNSNSNAQNICNVEELQNTTLTEPNSDEYMDGHNSRPNHEANNEECETVETTVEIELSDDIQGPPFVCEDEMVLTPKLETTTGDAFPSIMEADQPNEQESSGEVDSFVTIDDVDSSNSTGFNLKLPSKKRFKKSGKSSKLALHSRNRYEKHLPKPTKKDNGVTKKRMKTTFKCIVCEKINCDIHIQTGRQQSNRHHCRLCGKSYTRNSDLNRHMRAHTGETPYACRKCGKKFRRVDSLKHHSLHNCFVDEEEEAVSNIVTDQVAVQLGIRENDSPRFGGSFVRSPSSTRRKKKIPKRIS